MGWVFVLYPFLELWSLIELGAQTSALTALAWVLGAGVGAIATIGAAEGNELTHEKIEIIGSLPTMLARQVWHTQLPCKSRRRTRPASSRLWVSHVL